jgi:hypothetical protein
MAAFLLKPYSHLWWCFSILIAFEVNPFVSTGFAIGRHALLRGSLPEQSLWPGAGGIIAR